MANQYFNGVSDTLTICLNQLMMDRIIQVLHVMTLDVATVIRILYILNNVYAQADVDIVYVELILLQLNSLLMDLVLAMMQRSHRPNFYVMMNMGPNLPIVHR